MAPFLKLSSTEERDLLEAVETINKETRLSFGNEAQVIEFIDRLFRNPGDFSAAWRTPGFPFIGLNDIYERLTGEDHPVFLELSQNSLMFGVSKQPLKMIPERGAFSAADLCHHCCRLGDLLAPFLSKGPDVCPA